MEKPEYFVNDSPFNWFSENIQNCFYDSTWGNSIDRNDPLESALSSVVSSPTSSLPPICTDPGFAERAARFSCFTAGGLHALNGQLGLNESALGHLLVSKVEHGTLPRVSRAIDKPAISSCKKSSALKFGGTEFSESRDGSSISEQNPRGEFKNELLTRKRRWVSTGKGKEMDHLNVSTGSARSTVSSDAATDAKKENKDNPNPPKPPNDYIHVRARRGQATDSHSLAERVRREKISERMKLLQDLVPGCNKITGKALMLDEIINYVQSLQHQVEFLSMKLATINPTMGFNKDAVVSENILRFQPPPHTSDLGIPEFHCCPQSQGCSSVPGSSDLSPKCVTALTNQNPSMLLTPMNGYDDSYFPRF